MAENKSAEPISAVANAAGKLFDAVGGIIIADKQKDIEYQRWMAETYPNINWYFVDGEPKDPRITIIGFLSVLLVVVLIATAFVKSRKKK